MQKIQDKSKVDPKMIRELYTNKYIMNRNSNKMKEIEKKHLEFWNCIENSNLNKNKIDEIDDIFSEIIEAYEEIAFMEGYQQALKHSDKRE